MCFSFNRARMQKIFIFASLHSCILEQLLYGQLCFQILSEKFVNIGITSSKVSREGFGNLSIAEQGAWQREIFFRELSCGCRQGRRLCSWNGTDVKCSCFDNPNRVVETDIGLASICWGTFWAISHNFHSVLCDMGWWLYDTSRSIWNVFWKCGSWKVKYFYSIVNYYVIIERDCLEQVWSCMAEREQKKTKSFSTR